MQAEKNNLTVHDDAPAKRNDPKDGLLILLFILFINEFLTVKSVLTE